MSIARSYALEEGGPHYRDKKQGLAKGVERNLVRLSLYLIENGLRREIGAPERIKSKITLGIGEPGRVINAARSPVPDCFLVLILVSVNPLFGLITSW